LDQGQKSECASGKARGGGGLGALVARMRWNAACPAVVVDQLDIQAGAD
jgi:hypothetical protein